MTRAWPILLLILGLAWPAQAAVPAAAEPTLKAGKAWVVVTPSGDAAAILGAIDIAAPPRKVWDTMTNCELAKKMIANLIVCRTLQQGGGWDVREQVTKGNLFIPTLRNVIRSDYQPYSRIAFRRIDGDIPVMQGEWILQPLNGGKGTRVIYRNRVKAPIKAPAAVVRAGMKADCAKVLMNLKRMSGG